MVAVREFQYAGRLAAVQLQLRLAGRRGEVGLHRLARSAATAAHSGPHYKIADSAVTCLASRDLFREVNFFNMLNVRVCCGALVAFGTKRTFAALQQFVRYWTRADIEQPLSIDLDL